MGECPIQHSFLNRAPIRHRLLGYPQLLYTAVMQTRYTIAFKQTPLHVPAEQRTQRKVLRE